MIPPRPVPLPRGPLPSQVWEARMLILNQNRGTARQILLFSVLFGPLWLLSLAPIFGQTGSRPAALAYAGLSLLVCAGLTVLCGLGHERFLRRTIGDTPLPERTPPEHVVMAKGLVEQGRLGWHPGVNRTGYILAGQRLRQWADPGPRYAALGWGALAVLQTAFLTWSWWEFGFNVQEGLLCFTIFCNVVYAFLYPPIAREQERQATAFREEYEAWGASGDPLFPGFPERG